MQESHDIASVDFIVTREAHDLYQLAQMGQIGEPYMAKDLKELNARFSSDHKTLAAIQKQYRAMSKDDPLFINEVQIGKDGSLDFSSSKVTSPELQNMQLQFVADFTKRQDDKDKKNLVSLKADEKVLLADSAAMQKEEKNIVAHKQG
jgi:hypothetical protein